MNDLKKTFNKFVEAIRKPEMKILPGQLSYYFFLSLFPMITLLGIITSRFDSIHAELIKISGEIFPKEVVSILAPFFIGRGIDANVLIFMITGFIVTSNGPHSIIITSNTLYKIEHSDYLKRRIKAVFLTILLIFLLVFTLVVLAFGNNIIEFILQIKLIKRFDVEIYIFFLIIKWPLAFILTFLIIKLLYTAAPDKRIPSKYMNKGSFITTALWILLTGIYSYYVSNFTNYDVLYGSLSSIVVLMIWIYLLSYSLVLGIAINSSDIELENIE